MAATAQSTSPNATAQTAGPSISSASPTASTKADVKADGFWGLSAYLKWLEEQEAAKKSNNKPFQYWSYFMDFVKPESFGFFAPENMMGYAGHITKLTAGTKLRETDHSVVLDYGTSSKRKAIEVMPDSVRFLSDKPNKNFVYDDALRMARAAATNPNLVASGVLLEGTDKHKKLLKRAIDELNRTLPLESRLTVKNKEDIRPARFVPLAQSNAKPANLDSAPQDDLNNILRPKNDAPEEATAPSNDQTTGTANSAPKPQTKQNESTSSGQRLHLSLPEGYDPEADETAPSAEELEHAKGLAFKSSRVPVPSAQPEKLQPLILGKDEGTKLVVAGAFLVASVATSSPYGEAPAFPMEHAATPVSSVTMRDEISFKAQVAKQKDLTNLTKAFSQHVVLYQEGSGAIGAVARSEKYNPNTVLSDYLNMQQSGAPEVAVTRTPSGNTSVNGMLIPKAL